MEPNRFRLTLGEEGADTARRHPELSVSGLHRCGNARSLTFVASNRIGPDSFQFPAQFPYRINLLTWSVVALD